MRLIALKVNLDGCAPEVKKNLKGCENNPTYAWLPFWSHFALTEREQSALSDGNATLLSVLKQKRSGTLFSHNLTGEIPINIHAIVGKNGSGKSSVLDLVLRVINNFASKALGNKQLSHADGVDASLFYSIGDDENEGYHYISSKGDHSANINENDQLLANFFYTVAVNYSHYAFNTAEVHPIDISDDHWLAGLFHKNDGYLVPMVLNPMRTKGDFDINKERHLSLQRLCGVLTWKPDFLKGYMADGLQFRFYAKTLKDKLDNFLKYDWPNKGRDRKRLYVNSLREMYNLWKGSLSLSSIFMGNIATLPTIHSRLLKDPINMELQSTLIYLAYKTVSISHKYADFKDLKGDALIEKIKKDKSHITIKIKQALHQIDRLTGSSTQPTKDGDCTVYTYKIAEFKDQNKINNASLDSIFEWMYPGNYTPDIILKRTNPMERDDDKNEIRLSQMSSGERQMLYSMSSVLYHLVNLQSVPEGNTQNRQHYHHINIILDEVEMYYHPEYQRRFVNELVSMIEGLQLDHDKIKGINICIVTHSPFLLSDIPKSNILFIEDGKMTPAKGETFGANVYDILRNGFFLTQSVGEFFINRLQPIANDINEKTQKNIEITKTNKKNKGNNIAPTPLIKYELNKYTECEAVVKQIGERFLRDKLLRMLDELHPDISAKESEINRLRERLQTLEGQGL